MLHHHFVLGWSLKAEYLYTDLGSAAVLMGPGPIGGTVGTNHTMTDQIAGIGFNFRFGGGRRANGRPGEDGQPEATTLIGITNKASEIAAKDDDGREDKNSLAAWLKDRRNRRVIPHRLERCGYVPVRNPDAPSDGLWKRNGTRQAIYARTDLSLADRLKAVSQLPGLQQGGDLFKQGAGRCRR